MARLPWIGRGWAHAVCALLCCTLATLAHAAGDTPRVPRVDPAKADEADRLFDAALKLMDSGKWVEACAKFRASMAAAPSVGTSLNVADCSAREGRLTAALGEYRQALKMNEGTSDRARQRSIEGTALAAVRTLEQRIPRLTIVVTPNTAAATISIDGAPAASSGQPNSIDPGSHALRIEADGFVSVERAITTEEAQSVTLEIAMVQRTASGTPSDEGPALGVPGWTLGGAGLGAAIAGGALLGMASARAAEIEEVCGEGARPPVCDGSLALANELSDEGSTFELAGGVLLGVGAAGIAAGVILLIADATGTPAEHAAALAPVITAERAGLWVTIGY